MKSNLFDPPLLTGHFQDTEALLFGFQSIAETIDVNYSDVIPGLTALIPRVNISNVLLADTVMYTIGTSACLQSVCHVGLSAADLTVSSPLAGSLAEWLADHPVMMGRILPMVLQGLVKEELSVSSVSTLKRICRECRHDLCPFAEEILSVSQVRGMFCVEDFFFSLKNHLDNDTVMSRCRTRCSKTSTR